MEDKKHYSIGEVSEICNVTRKALRFYDKIGMIVPDEIGENNYRYYSRQTLLEVPVIKYYKQMGFRLEEMKQLINGSDYDQLERSFRSKMDELNELEKGLIIQRTSVKDWYNLILEARGVINERVSEVSVKYVEPVNCCSMEYDFNYSYMEAIINIDFTNFVEKIENAITGPVMILFPDFRQHMEGNAKKVRVIQKTLEPTCEDVTYTFIGGMYASCYHIGTHRNIGKTYDKILKWVEENNYKCENFSVERYVTDFWSTRYEENFVTEILIKISREK